MGGFTHLLTEARNPYLTHTAPPIRTAGRCYNPCEAESTKPNPFPDRVRLKLPSSPLRCVFRFERNFVPPTESFACSPAVNNPVGDFGQVLTASPLGVRKTSPVVNSPYPICSNCLSNNWAETSASRDAYGHELSLFHVDDFQTANEGELSTAALMASTRVDTAKSQKLPLMRSVAVSYVVISHLFYHVFEPMPLIIRYLAPEDNLSPECDVIGWG
jgi:hypothetical protein